MADMDRINWLKSALAASRKSQAFLARGLGVDRAVVSRMLGKGLAPGEEPRRITHEELVEISRILGVDPPFPGDVRAAGEFGGVIVKGRIAENVWVSGDVSALARPDRVGAVFHDRYPPKDQSAYQVDANGLEGEIFKVGDYLITVPFSDHRSRPLPNDEVVIKRTKRGLTCLTMRRAVPEGDALVLKPVLEGATEDNGSETEIIELVIGFQRYRV